VGGNLGWWGCGGGKPPKGNRKKSRTQGRNVEWEKNKGFLWLKLSQKGLDHRIFYKRHSKTIKKGKKGEGGKIEKIHPKKKTLFGPKGKVVHMWRGKQNRKRKRGTSLKTIQKKKGGKPLGNRNNLQRRANGG